MTSDKVASSEFYHYEKSANISMTVPEKWDLTSVFSVALAVTYEYDPMLKLMSRGHKSQNLC
jgi:hypothetical protein